MGPTERVLERVLGRAGRGLGVPPGPQASRARADGHLSPQGTATTSRTLR